ncbi:lipoprotein-releasing system permease protein [Zunongwangia mangrovi]|uniref:Lipoprotein-releasing system permease protein n=1 Tax=Zunongwangia mangrovi TaxID=1334022 RepID=A0A1I1DM14_9FLAO|nr:FtsX-like permease family protein [Zunongwangia mangrovi]SFB75931.1 lipoprotein-releasing system permease protein [Zunongwangia mangrovi]
MKFPLYIAKRYLFSKSSNNAINIITIIAAIGVFAGAFSLFIVLSGFSGLREFSLAFANEFDPDLKVIPKTGKTINFSEKLDEDFANIDGIASYSKTIEERVFLEYEEKTAWAFIKGVDERYQQVTQIDSSVDGTWFTSSEPQVVIGADISRKLNPGLFNYNRLMRLLVPKPGKGQITNPADAFNQKSVVVSGIYNINSDLNDKYVFSNIGFAQSLLDLDENTFSAVEIKLSAEADEESVKETILKSFDNSVEIRTRAQLNDVLYKMLNTENLAVYLIFTLVLIIALFNVVGSIIMVILDKKDNIKTLQSLGATPKQIKNIFFTQGMLMCTIGGGIGLLFAIILIYLQMQFDLVMITPSLAYPVTIEISNILTVILTIGILGLLASFLAAGRSKKALEE